MSLLHWLVLTPLLAAVFVPLLHSLFPRIHTGWFVLAVPIALAATGWTHFAALIADGRTLTAAVAWIPSLDVQFSLYLDGLSFLFMMLITGIGALVVFYSIFYLNKETELLQNFYTFLLAFMGAMLGVVLADNLILLYIFWELTSLSSALLIGYWYTRDRSRLGAQKSMLITVFGGFAMLVGFLLLYVMTGTFSVRGLIAAAGTIAAHDLFLPAMILILLGAFTKSAQFPFHIWLPDAMEAPTPVSAYLHSATMVKAGIYLIARLTPVFGGSAAWFWLILITGLVTLTWGSLSAVRQKDLKAALAFSTISQLGLLMTLLGVGSATLHAGDPAASTIFAFAVVAAIFHLISHATFKGSLFMAIGIIDHKTGTRMIDRLGGLMAVMPVTFAVAAVGFAAMAGVPPLNGFISKEMFFTGMLDAARAPFAGGLAVLIPLVAWLASVFTFLYCLFFFAKTFLGRFDRTHFQIDVREAPPGLLLSPVLLSMLVVGLGLFPNLATDAFIRPAVAGVLNGLPAGLEIDLALWHGITPELLMSLGVIAAGLLLFSLRGIWTRWTVYQRTRDVVNLAYDLSLSALTGGARLLTSLYMTGKLRTYLVVIIGFVLVLLSQMLRQGGALAMWPADLPAALEAPAYLYLIVLTMIAATLSVTLVDRRLTFFILIGVNGLLLSLLFAVFSAPDLALTQLLVETVIVLVLMVAFRKLPRLSREPMRAVRTWVNVLIAAGSGLLVTVLGVSAFALRDALGYDSIAAFFVQNAKPLGGGTNIVNVILVDFRGFDTALEIIVLSVAALAVLMLIKHRFKGGEDV